jgi:hypothetical protein
MSDADLYRQYAKEAMRWSSKVKDETEKQDLIDLAFTWAQAAMASERVLGSSFASSPTVSVPPHGQFLPDPAAALNSAFECRAGKRAWSHRRD